MDILLILVVCSNIAVLFYRNYSVSSVSQLAITANTLSQNKAEASVISLFTVVGLILTGAILASIMAIYIELRKGEQYIASAFVIMACIVIIALDMVILGIGYLL